MVWADRKRTELRPATPGRDREHRPSALRNLLDLPTSDQAAMADRYGGLL